MGDSADAPSPLQTRGYQQELLDESLRRNLIIALDTGSGKTYIAVLRMKIEAERNPHKVSWFLAPTVALAEQQKDVVEAFIPVKVGLVSGASEPDQWGDSGLWQKLLEKNRIIVSTPQILLNALSHGYVSLSQIGLLIFDEAHHATSKHPYNEIMKFFYFSLPQRGPGDALNAPVRPMILGLTASPVYGKDIAKGSRELECNLDSVICSSRFNREELSTHVHKPVFEYVEYSSPPYSPVDIMDRGPSQNTVALNKVINSLNIDDDPFVIHLRSQLRKSKEVVDRIDQKLSKAISSKDTYTHKCLRDLLSTARDICYDLGPWAADWYIGSVIAHINRSALSHSNILASLRESEMHYLRDALSSVGLTEAVDHPDAILNGLSPRMHKLIETLKREEAFSRSQGEAYSGIVFVTRRDSVLAISAILSRLPETAELFRIGTLLGTSTTFRRHPYQDVTRTMLQEKSGDVIRDFRVGEKNLVISTAVAEEGLDIQACGNVIRFDPPQNMVAWAQSRGRARRKNSRFIIMFDDTTGASRVQEWEQMEKQMVASYTSVEKIPPPAQEEPDEISYLDFRVESTGALLTLESVMGHLHHFCAVLPSSGYGSNQPYFELDPPDFPVSWHMNQVELQPSEGPWSATCVLPRILPPHLRRFKTDFSYRSKSSARNHAAFEAYVTLYEEGLLNDHLLPFTGMLEEDSGAEIKLLLDEIEKRAGLQNVSVQMNPWLDPTRTENWSCYELSIGELPPLFMLTRQTLPVLSEADLPTLYVPGVDPVQMRLQPMDAINVGESMIRDAEKYTRAIFRALHGERVDAERTDFAYMFLPVKPGEDEPNWDHRRSWQRLRWERSERVRWENRDRANAAVLGKEYAYPLDLSIVRSNDKISKTLRFVGWHDGPISKLEEEELKERYDGIENATITYPLLVVQELPRRVNFLVPLEDQYAGLRHEQPFLLITSQATVDLLSRDDLQYSLFLPSVLRGLAKAITAASLREELFSSTPLRDIPLHLLTRATAAPVSQEDNYQRLETLGDAVLKYVTSIQVFAEHPYWHEGYLTRRKDHIVNNNQLAKRAVGKGLYRWIVRDRFVPRRWMPHYLGDRVEGNPKEPEVKEVEIELEGSGKELTPKERRAEARRKRQQQLGTKVIADVVESLIGAAYIHGGFDLAVDCVSVFGLGLSRWEPVSRRVSAALQRVQQVDDLPPALSLVERMIGYQFTHKMLLAEALTHVSYQGDLDNVSYERLEFLGDCTLDMIVAHFLYHASGKNYSPGHMHLRKEAFVNSHFLAFICMDTSIVLDSTMPSWDPQNGLRKSTEEQQISLWQCLLHSSHAVLDDQMLTRSRYEKHAREIKNALHKSSYYPWALLTSLQAPKFVSDLIESLLGAVFLDAQGNLDTVRQVMKHLGMYSIMERIVEQDVDVLHPLSRLAIWAAKQVPQKKLEIKVGRGEGMIICTVLVDGEEVAQASERFRGKVSRNRVRFAASDAAIRKLHVIEEETPDDVDDVGWPDDVPVYDW